MFLEETTLYRSKRGCAQWGSTIREREEPVFIGWALLMRGICYVRVLIQQLLVVLLAGLLQLDDGPKNKASCPKCSLRSLDEWEKPALH